MDNRKIAIFDSGVGGMTVLKEIVRELPSEEIIYVGDTINTPYGTKSAEVVIDYCKDIMDFLMDKNVKAVVVACNTATAHGLEKLSKLYPVPIYGVINPGVVEAVKANKNNKIGVIATEGTIKSGAYTSGICNLVDNKTIYSKACTIFVPLVEEGYSKHEGTGLIVKDHLKELTSYGIDTLILGCTHFPLLKEHVKNAFDYNINIIDPASKTAKQVKKSLGELDLLSDNDIVSDGDFKYTIYFTSDDTITNKTFKTICKEVLGVDPYTSDKFSIETVKLNKDI